MGRRRFLRIVSLVFVHAKRCAPCTTQINRSDSQWNSTDHPTNTPQWCGAEREILMCRRKENTLQFNDSQYSRIQFHLDQFSRWFDSIWFYTVSVHLTVVVSISISIDRINVDIVDCVSVCVNFSFICRMAVRIDVRGHVN